jgi:hypothetical protein
MDRDDTSFGIHDAVEIPTRDEFSWPHDTIFESIYLSTLWLLLCNVGVYVAGIPPGITRKSPKLYPFRSRVEDSGRDMQQRAIITSKCKPTRSS